MFEKSCETCKYAVITLVKECSKRDENDEYVHTGGFCVDELICEYWEQGSELDIHMNSFDWSQAKIIKVK